MVTLVDVNMDRHTQLVAALFLTVLNSALAEHKRMYSVLGGGLVLSPPEASTQHVTSILWKHNSNLLAEWVEGEADLKYYGRFNGRTTLNTTTGCLEISNVTKADRGFYSVEINNRSQSDRFDAEVIKKVPKPEVLVCTSASESCNVTCDGATTDTGPVAYSWKMGDGDWKESDKSIIIYNTEDIRRVETFTCRMKNPVSEEDSEPHINPFSPRRRPNSSCWVRVVLIIMTLVGSVSFLWAVAYVLWRNRMTLTSCVTEKGADH